MPPFLINDPNGAPIKNIDIHAKAWAYFFISSISFLLISKF